MLTQLGLVYGPAFFIFGCAVWFTTAGSRWSLAAAGLSFLSGCLIIGQTMWPDPAKGFFNWLPWLLICSSAAALLPRTISKWVSLLLFIGSASLMINKVISFNDDWSPVEQWINGSVLVLLPLLLSWFATTRKSTQAATPWYTFLTCGLVILFLLINYLIAGTSKTALILGSGGILCASGFLVSLIKKQSISDLAPLAQVMFFILWFCTCYVHYFTDNLPFGASLLLLVAGPLCFWLHQTMKSWKMKLLTVITLIGMGGGSVVWVSQTNTSSEDSAEEYFGY